MGFRHRSIRLRVGILVAVPVVFLFTLYSVAAGLSLGSATAQTRAKSVRAELALPISNFQQQLALERGLAVLRVATPANQAIRQRFVRQQAATTKSLTRLEAVVSSAAVESNASSSERGSMRALVRQRASLNLLRSAVSGNTITMRAAVARYDAIINIGNTALDAICDAQVNIAIVTQSLEILTLDKADQAAIAETDLLAGDIAQARFPDADRITIASLAATRQQLIDSALPDASRNFRTEFATHLRPAVTSAIVTAESTVRSTPWRAGAPPPKVTTARAGFIAYSGSLGRALASASDSLQQTIDRQAISVQLELIVAAGIGLLALMGTIVLSVIVGNGLLHQLRELRGSALVLAHDKLPHVMAQVRAGQPVDLAEFAPPEVPSRNEIEQVQQAFGVVQQAAVQAAVEEAKLRRGVSDIFRNLAGRSQSLLHRQLTLLDGMERRASEPEELDALFRLDHLTTRMRRHAEGLIILAGDTPARGWRQPVPLIDVLRGAVAEVEDYTRIRVQCRTSAAVAGHAVADIVHLIAELAENATVFSPPNTPVRMQGDSVGRGLAIEIEDRGLGMSQARLEEINANLANPPQFDLSGSDRLGLFIASQLAQRHDVKVTLRASVYGGITAVVLLPTDLVVDASALEGGVRPAALAAGNGRSGMVSDRPDMAGEDDESPRSGGFIYAGLTPDPQPRASGTPAPDDKLDTSAPAPKEFTDVGLPVRVRQASLAPQLRDPSPASGREGLELPRRRASATQSATPTARPPARHQAAAPPAPEAARDMVSALQSGWQLGRAEMPPELAKPTGPEPSATRATSPKPSGPKSNSPKPDASKPNEAKSNGRKPAASKQSTPKPTGSQQGTAEPSATKPNETGHHDDAG